MNHTLLTVSGVIDHNIEAQIGRGERPQADYIAMARAFNADILDHTLARRQTGRAGRLLERMGGANLLLAWAAFRKRRFYRAIFTDGEQVGLPLALLLKTVGGRLRPRHLMIGHLLSAKKKRPFFDTLRLQTHIDTIFVYATWQQRFAQERWQLPSRQVIFTPFMVDADFFAPSPARHAALPVEIDPQRPLICAVGLEFRDYPTLLAAVRNLDVQVVIAAASPWSKRGDSTANEEIPSNVIVHRFSQFELRELYARSQFVVVPLYETPFQAGVTTLLEAMAMEKAVICTRTAGQTDVVAHELTGLYVPPADADALRAAICRLLQNPGEARRMGQAGRQLILKEMSLDHYTTRLNRYVQTLANNGE